MSVSDAHSTTQAPTTDDQADVRQLFRLIADNFSKEELGSLVLNQEYKQYHTMASTYSSPQHSKRIEIANLQR
jgi:hypothetical protein